MTEALRSLHAKLAEVMAEVGRIPKRGRNEFHKYDYATEADIVEAVRGELSSRRVTLIPAVTEVAREGTLTTALMTFTFTDADTGETDTRCWAGTGDDKGDKGLYKALTGALKYFLLKAFLMPTGDDPEADESTDVRASGGRARPAPRTTKPKTMSESERDEAWDKPEAPVEATRPNDPPGWVRIGGAATPEIWPPNDLEPAEIDKERKAAHAAMKEFGIESQEDRWAIYARVSGREMHTYSKTQNEAWVKGWTAGAWRRVQMFVRAINTPPDVA